MIKDFSYNRNDDEAVRIAPNSLFPWLVMQIAKTLGRRRLDIDTTRSRRSTSYRCRPEGHYYLWIF